MFPREHFASATDLIPVYYRLREILRPMIMVGHYGASIILLLMPEHAGASEAKEHQKQVQNALQKAQIRRPKQGPFFSGGCPRFGSTTRGQVVFGMALDKEPNESVSSEFSIAELPDGDDLRSVAGHTFVVASEKMRTLFETVEKAAQAPISVIIYGETGLEKNASQKPFMKGVQEDKASN